MKFEKLVSELDHDTLEDLRRTVAAEIDARRPVIQLADIHPRMTEEEKEIVAREIARVLGGENA